MPKPSHKVSSYLSVRDFAEHVGMSQKTIRRWIDAGDLPVHRLGGCLRIAEEDAVSFLAARRWR